MPRRGEPVGDGLGEILRGHAGMGGHRRSPAGPSRPPPRAAFMSPASTDLNGSVVFHSGCCGARRLTRRRRRPLEVERLLAHSVPSLSKVAMRSGDGTKSGAALLRDPRDEIDDGRLGRAVVPGRQRIRLGKGWGDRAGKTADREPGEYRPSAEAAKQSVACSFPSECTGSELDLCSRPISGAGHCIAWASPRHSWTKVLQRHGNA